ncbi:MAG: hypothetical protein JWR01_2963, partial [Subtercola sp.]|nr:hypothetical protein [Subtercola sp.]
MGECLSSPRRTPNAKGTIVRPTVILPHGLAGVQVCAGAVAVPGQVLLRWSGSPRVFPKDVRSAPGPAGVPGPSDHYTDSGDHAVRQTSEVEHGTVWIGLVADSHPCVETICRFWGVWCVSRTRAQ